MAKRSKSEQLDATQIACEDERAQASTTMRILIDELGGASVVAKMMHDRHGKHPMLIAIEILGGVTATAKILGITKQALSDRMTKDMDHWTSGYLRRIEEETKIPVQTLTMDLRPPREAKAAERASAASGDDDV